MATWVILRAVYETIVKCQTEFRSEPVWLLTLGSGDGLRHLMMDPLKSTCGNMWNTELGARLGKHLGQDASPLLTHSHTLRAI